MVTSLGGHVVFPTDVLMVASTHRLGGTHSTMAQDATGEKTSVVGRLRLSGQATSKTFSSSGAKVHWYGGASVWSDAATVLRVGLQGIDTSSLGSIPNASWLTYSDITPSGGANPVTITNAQWNSASMTNGSVSLSDGDFVAVVFDMTTRSGSDVFYSSCWVSSLSGSKHGLQGINTAGTWSWNNRGSVMIETDDGTIGYVDFAWPATYTLESYNSSTVSGSGGDERGLIFQVPIACEIDGFYVGVSVANVAADFDVVLYSTPLGTPSVMLTKSVLAEQCGTSGSVFAIWVPTGSGSEQSLLANTDYCVAVKPTNTTNVSLSTHVPFNAAAREFWPGGTNLRKGHRTDGSGAFTETDTIIPAISVRISGVETGGALLTGLKRGIRI